MRSIGLFSATVLASVSTPIAALAAQPEPWQFGLQPAATPVAERLNDFHNLLLVIITAITVLVLALMVYAVWRFSEKRNPEPAKFSHNMLVEVIWTGVPILVLVVIAVPSMALLYYMDRAPETELTVKAIGYQWYWGYELPEQGIEEFQAYMVPDDEIEDGMSRLLETDNRLILPVDTKILLQVTAGDVLHAFALPAFGVKVDAIPGRLNQTWIEVTREGVYYGQCSEICGTGHAFMPIAIEVVSREAFDAWVETMLAEQGTTDFEPVKLARATTP